MSVNRLFSPQTLCYCPSNTENESMNEAVITGNISPVRKLFARPSTDGKKKISIKKHIEGSLKKKKSEEPEGKPIPFPKSYNNYTKIDNYANLIGNQNKPNSLNQRQITYQQPVIIKQQPKIIPRQIIHISHHYHFNAIEYNQQQTLERNMSPSIAFSKLTINPPSESHPSLKISKQSQSFKLQSKHSTTIPSVSKTTASQFQPYPHKSKHQFIFQDQMNQRQNGLSEFRNVESVYEGSLQNSIGSNVSIIEKNYFDRNYIYELSNYKVRGDRLSNNTTAYKARTSTAQKSDKYLD